MVSVIIPVFNTEKYIGRCIESVLHSQYNEFEIIIIDDGSTDASAEICKYYSNRDSRINYYYQENAGVSVARNVGIEMARGEWIVFLDSDDYILDNYFNLIEEKGNGNDIIFFDSIWCGMKNKSLDKDILLENDRFLDFVEKAILSQSLFDHRNVSARSPCAKAYNRFFLEKHNLRFPNGISIGEDELFNIQVYCCMDKGLYVPQYVYNVEYREGSATHSFHNDLLEHNMLFYRMLKDILNNNGIFSTLQKQYYDSVLSGVVSNLKNFIFYKNNRIKWKERKKHAKNMMQEKIYIEALSFNYKTGSLKRRILLAALQLRQYVLIGLYFFITGE